MMKLRNKNLATTSESEQICILEHVYLNNLTIDYSLNGVGQVLLNHTVTEVSGHSVQ